jgi:hypothetical protein
MGAKVVGGSDNTTEVRQQIYLSGIDDLITGNWNFNNKLYLYDEDNQAYAGVAYASSEWGYNIFLEADNGTISTPLRVATPIREQWS